MTVAQHDYPALGFDPAPGDLGQVSTVATKYGTVSRSLTSADESLRDILNQRGIWQGEASEAFARKVDDLPRYLENAARSMSQAASALSQWQQDLSELQRRARELEQQAKQAQQQAQQAQQNPDLKLANQTFSDQQSLQNAQRLLDNAEQQLNGAITNCTNIQEEAKRLLEQHTQTAERVAELLRKAMELAPEEPGMLGSIVGFFTDLGEDIANAVIDGLTVVGQAITDFIEDNAQLIAKLADVVGDIGTIVGVVADFLPPPAEQIAGAISVGLGVTALGGHGLAAAAGADIPPETFAIDAIGIASGAVGLIPGVPGSLMRFSGTAMVAGQAGGEIATGGEGATFFDNLDTYWKPRDPAQAAIYGGSVLSPVAALSVPFANAINDGIAADNAGQAERDRQRAEERVWQ
ncbi:hypothetical protein EV191_105181 [Tamaricihabitans halophyticus]|uniref:Putative T7SS secretion signal domain-containing protein n=1 Tax=Tamaricihabitans halophyticus TaxID=1262583 RepID=A0A4R2QW35_9PSEU|nr:hypothetical protein [Tamaricihabitans halophyticus]TCP53118.1 hypothetical protein EV191_105181 [Tamaricihabitans halophyticus]